MTFKERGHSLLNEDAAHQEHSNNVERALHIRRIKEKRTKKILIIGLVVVFSLYCIVWYLLTRNTPNDPLIQLQHLFSQLKSSDNGTVASLPWPKQLSHYSSSMTEGDIRAFEIGTNLLTKDTDPKKAGRILWPIAALYPEIRPSIARDYYDQARMRRAENPEEALVRIKMALAFSSKGIRENLLAADIYKGLGNQEDAGKHSLLANKYFAMWQRETVEPPAITITLFLLFVAGLIGATAYYYWDELNLAMHIAKLLGKPVPQRQHDLSYTTPGMPAVNVTGDLPVPSTQDKNSITGILKAEDFLKVVQDAFDQKTYEKGVDLCQKAVELNPANAPKVSQACLKEGIGLYEIGDFDQAIELLEVSLHFAPHTVQAHLCLGNCFIKLGAYTDAQRHYEQVISITPQNSDAYYTLGVCYQKVNDLKKARRSFEVAVKLKPHANSHFYLAKICEKEKDIDGAIEHWEKFINLAEGNPQAPSARKRLEMLVAKRDGTG
jgi:tetratricopeptide (TPR) repeat protein